ncbi:hypothetical protein HNY73_011093 [Argiope bruennichi]|uniref:Uncharacterized protein n=1 Tax=Argiope bruennichi TaxID=94029 RepID=A0A8T0F5N1_ARGBR|nr:hypothetical protein HNY73_011093 [Argiope bruennichi]
MCHSDWHRAPSLRMMRPLWMRNTHPIALFISFGVDFLLRLHFRSSKFFLVEGNERSSAPPQMKFSICSSGSKIFMLRKNNNRCLHRRKQSVFLKGDQSAQESDMSFVFKKSGFIILKKRYLNNGYIFSVRKGPFIEEFYQCVTYGFYTSLRQEQVYTIFTLVVMFAVPLMSLIGTYAETFFTIATSIADRIRKSDRAAAAIACAALQDLGVITEEDKTM